MFGIGLTFGAEMFYRFRGLHVCRFGACPFDHIDEGLWIFQHRAGAEVIMVEGLSFGIFLEQGLLETGDEVLVVDVGAGVVDEDARFDVAVGVDMAIIAAAGDTAIDELAVVLEVDGEYRLAAFDAADFTDAAYHIGPLFRRGQ